MFSVQHQLPYQQSKEKSQEKEHRQVNVEGAEVRLHMIHKLPQSSFQVVPSVPHIEEQLDPEPGSV